MGSRNTSNQSYEYSIELSQKVMLFTIVRFEDIIKQARKRYCTVKTIELEKLKF